MFICLIRTSRGGLSMHGVYMTDRRSVITCQASRSWSSVLLECLLEWLIHLVSDLQNSHCHWIYQSTWTMVRAHSHRHTVGLAMPDSLKMCHFILHNFSPFHVIFFLHMTHHFSVDRYRWKIKRFVFKSLFNRFVGICATPKPLFKCSSMAIVSSFDGDSPWKHFRSWEGKIN